MPVIESKISIVNVVGFATLLASAALTYGQLTSRVTANQEAIEELQVIQKEQYGVLDGRTRSLELRSATNDQKLANILEIVKETKDTVDRLARQ